MPSTDQQIQEFFRAARNGDEDAVKYVEQYINTLKGDVNVQHNILKHTALMVAAQHGHVNIVDLLIKAGANVDLKGVDQDTALMVAAQHSHINVVDLLIKAGAKVDEKNKSGHTALIYAAQNGFVNIVDLLIKAGAKVDEKNKSGDTALDVVLVRVDCTTSILEVLERYKNIIQLLVTAGAKANESILAILSSGTKAILDEANEDAPPPLRPAVAPIMAVSVLTSSDRKKFLDAVQKGKLKIIKQIKKIRQILEQEKIKRNAVTQTTVDTNVEHESADDVEVVEVEPLESGAPVPPPKPPRPTGKHRTPLAMPVPAPAMPVSAPVPVSAPSPIAPIVPAKLVTALPTAPTLVPSSVVQIVQQTVQPVRQPVKRSVPKPVPKRIFRTAVEPIPTVESQKRDGIILKVVKAIVSVPAGVGIGILKVPIDSWKLSLKKEFSLKGSIDFLALMILRLILNPLIYTKNIFKQWTAKSYKLQGEDTTIEKYTIINPKDLENKKIHVITDGKERYIVRQKHDKAAKVFDSTGKRLKDDNVANKYLRKCEAVDRVKYRRESSIEPSIEQSRQL